jgi:hypothetical protein
MQEIDESTLRLDTHRHKQQEDRHLQKVVNTSTDELGRATVVRARMMLHLCLNPATKQLPGKRLRSPLHLALNCPRSDSKLNNCRWKDRFRNGGGVTPRLRMRYRRQPKIPAQKFNCPPQSCQSYLHSLRKRHGTRTGYPGLYETLCKRRLVRPTKGLETMKPHQTCLTAQLRHGSGVVEVNDAKRSAKSQVGQLDASKGCIQSTFEGTR